MDTTIDGTSRPPLDAQLNIVDLLKKYKIQYSDGKYYWNNDVFESYKEPLTKAQRVQTTEEDAVEKDTVSAPSQQTGEDSGFFAPERAGIANGITGGLAMIGIAVVWFFAGKAMGYIFYYPPILGAIGVYALLKGLFTGNVSGKKAQNTT